MDDGRRSDGLTTEARIELLRLKRENKRLRIERDIPKMPRPGSRGRTDQSWREYKFVKAHRAEFPAHGHVPGAGSFPQRVLRSTEASSLGASAARRRTSGQERSGLEGQPRDVRPPADPPGAAGGGRAGGPEASGAADERAGIQGRDPEVLAVGHDPQGREGPVRARPGEPGLLRRGPEPDCGSPTSRT